MNQVHSFLVVWHQRNQRIVSDSDEVDQYHKLEDSFWCQGHNRLLTCGFAGLFVRVFQDVERCEIVFTNVVLFATLDFRRHSLSNLRNIIFYNVVNVLTPFCSCHNV